MNILESILQAFESVRSNTLRTILTLLSISIGIFSIIGAGSAVATLDSAVNTQLVAMGENSFMIRRTPTINMGNSWRKYRNRKDITYAQAKEFKNNIESTDLISISDETNGYTAKVGNLSTDPDISLIGCDENFFTIKNMQIIEGRSFSAQEVLSATSTAIIGNDIVLKLFNGRKAIGEYLTLKNQQFLIIGILKSQGSMFGKSLDNQIMIPISTFMRYHTDEWGSSVEITGQAYSKQSFLQTVDESIGTMRSLRNVKPWEDNSFEIETNETISNQFASFTGYLSMFGIASGIISLLAAGVGIMNIMLVSVKERTREIGIRKAIGAKKNWILFQFIIEAITLCQLGGIIGIAFGVIAANGLSTLINAETQIPLFWVLFSVGTCTLMGLIFGSYPAWKAACLDPIEALRYE